MVASWTTIGALVLYGSEKIVAVMMWLMNMWLESWQRSPLAHRFWGFGRGIEQRSPRPPPQSQLGKEHHHPGAPDRLVAAPSSFFSCFRSRVAWNVLSKRIIYLISTRGPSRFGGSHAVHREMHPSWGCVRDGSTDTVTRTLSCNGVLLVC